MVSLLPALLGLALVDSLNPSAIGVTIYLTLSGAGYVRRVLSYLAGVFVTYLTIGVLLMLGVSTRGEQLGRLLSTPVAYGIQLGLGAVLALLRRPRAEPESTR